MKKLLLSFLFLLLFSPLVHAYSYNPFTGELDKSGSSGSGATTDGGATTYVTSTTDDFAVGGTDSTSDLYIDVSEDLVVINGNLTIFGNTTFSGTIYIDTISGGSMNISSNLTVANNLIADSTGIEGNNLQADSVLDAALSASVSSLVNDAGYIKQDDTNLDFVNDVDFSSNVTVEGDLVADTKTLSQSGATTVKTQEQYGTILYADGNLSLSGVADGMVLTVVTVGASTVKVDPNSSDTILLNGTPLSAGDQLNSSGTSGDVAVLSYYDTNKWYASTKGTWTDGN